MSETPTNSAPNEPGKPASSKVEQASGLWARVKEHKILQWGLGYLGAALALAHGQELLAQTYEWPHSIGQIFIGALIVGLPIVLTLAWYHGHKGLKQFSAAEMTIVALLLVLVGGGFFLFVRAPGNGSHGGTERPASLAGHSAPTPAPATGQDSLASSHENTAARQAPAPMTVPSEGGVTLAVLPFVNLSGDASQEYFSDGLSEELLDQLARLNGLRVTARTSSFAFKGKNEDMRVIGQALGVANLLEGSVRKSGNRLRITAQLINAADGTHLWSNTYDRELTDVFAVQEDIGKEVAKALSVTLGVGEALGSGGTKSIEAHDLYLKGRAEARNGTADGFRRAIAYYRQAVAADPQFARAWLGLAAISSTLSLFAPEEAQAAAPDIALGLARASALRSNQAETLLLKMWQAWIIDHDIVVAGHALDSALAIDPTGAKISSGFQGAGATDYALALLAYGRASETIPLYEAARAADPLSPRSWFQVALDMVGRSREAAAEFERTKDLPGGSTGPAIASNMFRRWAQGDAAGARAEFEKLIALGTNLPFYTELLPVFDKPEPALALLRRALADPFYHAPPRPQIIAQFAVHYGDEDLALAALRLGFVDKKGVLLQDLWRPVFADVRKTKGFKQLVRDLGLVTYWRESGHWGDFCHPLGTDDFECK